MKIMSCELLPLSVWSHRRFKSARRPANSYNRAGDGFLLRVRAIATRARIGDGALGRLPRWWKRGVSVFGFAFSGHALLDNDSRLRRLRAAFQTVALTSQEAISRMQSRCACPTITLNTNKML
jgi:hypothetical protein